MNKYQVTFSDGAVLNYAAHTSKAAKHQAKNRVKGQNVRIVDLQQVS